MRKSGLSPKDKKGIVLIVISLLVLVLMFSLVGWLKHKSGYDEVTFCPDNIEYNTSVIIIDKSDRWKKHDAIKIVKLINSIATKLKQYERLQIKVIHSSDKNNIALIDTYFDFCNPGSKANPLYQNPRKILKKYKEKFEIPLQKVTEVLTRPGYADSTPLLRTIQEAVVNSSSEKIKLTLVSDLFEYSEDYNFYKDKPDVTNLINDFNLRNKGISEINVKYIRRKKHSEVLVKRVGKIFRQIASELNANYSQETFMVTSDPYIPIKTKKYSSNKAKNKKASFNSNKNYKNTKRGLSRNSVDIYKAARIILNNK